MVRVAVALLLLVLPSAAWAQGEKRIALLIGNQGYNAKVGPLRNPHNDVAAVGKALEAIGFKTTTLRDTGRREVLSAVTTFGEQLAREGPNAVGFFYYSGHGLSRPDNRANYLIPVDLRDTESSDFWFDAVKLDDLLAELERAAPSAAHFVVFDACRNELKLPVKSAARLGFAPVTERSGMYIAFATAPGAVASDQGAASGPYAGALAAELMRPGQDHLQLFQNVKEGVYSTTGNRQMPWASDGLVRRIYLGGGSIEARPSPVAPAPPPAQPRLSEASEEWSRLDKTSIAELETFLRRHGSSLEADYARARLEELRKRVALAEPPAKPDPPKPAFQEPSSRTSWSSPDAVREALYKTIMYSSRSVKNIDTYHAFRRPKAMAVCVDWGTTTPTVLNGGQKHTRWRLSGDGRCRELSAQECGRRARERCEEIGECKGRGQKCLVVDINGKNAIVLDHAWLQQFVR